MPPPNNIKKPSRKRKELDDFTRGMICALSIHGEWKQVSICKELGLKPSTVSDVINKYRKEGLKSTKKRSGRPRIQKINKEQQQQ